MNNNLVSGVSALNDEAMELVMMALLYIIVRDGRVQDMVNNTVLGVMPDLQLEDENGEATLTANAIHGVVFAALWWVLGELRLRL